jgi:hypothetical protein
MVEGKKMEEDEDEDDYMSAKFLESAKEVDFEILKQKINESTFNSKVSTVDKVSN